MNKSIADLTAFLLAFSGDGFDERRTGFPSRDAVAAVGRQITLSAPGGDPLVTAMMQLITTDTPGVVELVAKGKKDGVARGWFLDSRTFTNIGRFQSDRESERITMDDLLALAAPGAELTFTVVPAGTGRRIGTDRDGDFYGDRDELDLGADPTISTPLLLSISVTPTEVLLSWSSLSGFTYRVEYKGRLDEAIWTSLGADITASGTKTTKTETNVSSGENRFYRVLRVAPP